MKSLEHIILISNANFNLKKIKYLPGYRAERWSISRVLQLFGSLPTEELNRALGISPASKANPKNIWLIRGSFSKNEPGFFSELPVKPDFDDIKFVGNYYAKVTAHGHYVIERDLRVLRLLCNCDLFITATLEFLANSHDPFDFEEFLGMMVDRHVRKPGQMSINGISWNSATDYLRRYDDVNSKTNFDLSLRSYDLSFTVGDSHVAFVVLVTALESLLNISNVELKYRVSRAVAVLLGRTKSESEQLFRQVQELYDIRSQIVHTGTSKKFTDAKLQELRSVVRAVLLKVLMLNRPKEKLVQELGMMGYGKTSSLR